MFEARHKDHSKPNSKLDSILDKMDLRIYPASPLIICGYEICQTKLQLKFAGHLQSSTFPSDYQIIFDLRSLANPHVITYSVEEILDLVSPERYPSSLSIKYLYLANQNQDVAWRGERLLTKLDEIRTVTTERLFAAIFPVLDFVNMPINLMSYMLEYLVQPPHNGLGLSANMLISQTIEKQGLIRDKRGFSLLGFFPSEAEPKPNRTHLYKLLTQNLKIQFEGVVGIRTGLNLDIILEDIESARTCNNIIKATNIKTVLSYEMITISGKNIQKFMDAYGKMDATLFFESENVKSSCAIS